MNDSPHYSAADIDALVQRVLRADAERVDVEKVCAAIKARLLDEGDRAASKRSRWGWIPRRVRAIPARRFAVAAAATIVIGLVWWSLSPTQISAHAMVVAAHEKVTATDRCYEVVIDRPQSARIRNFLLQGGWQTQVWTRGNRFRATMHAANKHLVWGQDGQRNVWLVRNPQSGLQFANDEVPPMLRAARELLSLDIKRLTRRFANDYDLAYAKPNAADGTNVAVIRATARAGNVKVVTNVIGSARLVIDRDTNVIHQMQLFRAGHAEASATFTLVGEQPQPDSVYRLRGNLDRGAEVLDGQQVAQREQAFSQLSATLSGAD